MSKSKTDSSDPVIKAAYNAIEPCIGVRPTTDVFGSLHYCSASISTAAAATAPAVDIEHRMTSTSDVSGHTTPIAIGLDAMRSITRGPQPMTPLVTFGDRMAWALDCSVADVHRRIHHHMMAVDRSRSDEYEHSRIVPVTWLDRPVLAVHDVGPLMVMMLHASLGSTEVEERCIACWSPRMYYDTTRTVTMDENSCGMYLCQVMP